MSIGSTGRVIVAVTVCCLAGCAQPAPGSNAGAGVAASPTTPLVTHPTVAQEVGAVADNRVQIEFPNGGASLMAKTQHNLDLAARLFRDVDPVAMFVSGYSDNLGDEYHNLLLSARRAEAVKQALVARGIPPNRLLLQAYGTSEPVSSAAAQAAENRRVVITWRLL